MTHFVDLTTYAYTPIDPGGLLNIGWLTARASFATGPTPPDFATRLARGVRERVAAVLRGVHDCEFCDLVSPVEWAVDDGTVWLGTGEIRIAGGDGARYAAPTLIVHYVDAHDYRPPQPFIDAVYADPRLAGPPSPWWARILRRRPA